MATLSSHHQQLSPELANFLAAEVEGDDPTVDDTNAPSLDITTAHVSLEGVDEELEHFRNHEVLKAILDQGCDPKEYGRQYEAKLRQAELDSIEDYISETDNLVQLHEQIRACDGILATMEELLGKFQSDLGSISSEIRSLQEHSQSMSIKLRNRKAAQERMGQFLQHVVLPSALITTIVQGEVDEDFVAALRTLASKLAFADSDPQAQTAAALRDVAPELEKLRAKAAARSRDFLLQRIYSLRKDKTNIQILQQNVLLKYKYLVAFLQAHGREVFEEVRTAYVDTLSRVLASKFRAYITATDKLLVTDVPTPADLLGNPDATQGGVMAMFNRGATTHHKADVFALGNRGALLGQLDSPAVIPHIEESKGGRFHYEVIFRSLHKLVIDTATTEMQFCAAFCPGDAALFTEVFTPTLQVVEGATSSFLQETHDMIAVLLMIRVNSVHSAVVGPRGIQCLDDYLDRLKLLLWPKLKAMFDAQLNSLRAFNPSTHPWTELKVHYVTERYAHLTCSMLALNGDGTDGPLDGNIERVKAAMIELLLRLSRGMPKKKQGMALLLLNFSFVLSVLQAAAQRIRGGASVPAPEAGIEPLGALGALIVKEFEEQVSNCTAMYVEEVLTEHFGRLVAFVKKAETAQKLQGVPENTPVPKYGPAEAAPVVTDFTAKWSSGIDSLHKEVMRDFASAAGCGREVLKACMTQLLLYYTRLLEMLKRAGPEGQALVRDAVTVPSIMYSIRAKKT